VARALSREGVAFEEVVVPQSRTRRPEVQALTDQRRVPVLVIDGEAICDSHRILEYLEFRRGCGPSREAGREDDA
jgi:glutathione S-transferase